MIPNIEEYYTPEWAGDGKAFSYKGEKVIPIFLNLKDMDQFMIEHNGLYDDYLIIDNFLDFCDIIHENSIKVAVVQNGKIIQII